MAERLGVGFRSVQDLEAKGATPKTPAAMERLVGLGRQVGIEVQEVRPPKPDKPDFRFLSDPNDIPDYKQAPAPGTEPNVRRMAAF